MEHPRDRFLTVYGRKPVLEVLEQRDLRVARVFVARSARGPMLDRIREAARERGLSIVEKSEKEISRISRSAKQDQGVAADVEAPRMRAFSEWLESHDDLAVVFALDHVTTPANVGMIVRTVTALGLDGVIVPRRGCPEIGPLVIKASAGFAFRAPILRCAELSDALSDAKMRGFAVYGMADDAERELGSLDPRERAIFVFGNETDGIGEATRPLVDEWVSIGMPNRGDSLNVASAAAIVAYALARRRCRS